MEEQEQIREYLIIPAEAGTLSVSVMKRTDIITEDKTYTGTPHRTAFELNKSDSDKILAILNSAASEVGFSVPE